MPSPVDLCAVAASRNSGASVAAPISYFCITNVT
jgi:hypothetical protein